MVIQLRTNWTFQMNQVTFTHIQGMVSSVYKDEETKAVRKSDFITQAFSVEPAIDGS